MEGKWVHKIFSEICDKNQLDAGFKLRVMEMLESLNKFFEGLGFCLSECGDMLSQWRGYAEDAEGFSVGFSREELESLSASLRNNEKFGFALAKVNYDMDKQREELEPQYREIKRLIDKGAFRISSLLGDAGKSEDEIRKQNEDRKKAISLISLQILTLYPRLFEQKNPAFAEEREWQVISPLVKDNDEGIEFRLAGDRIIPYRSFVFEPNLGSSKKLF